MTKDIYDDKTIDVTADVNVTNETVSVAGVAGMTETSDNASMAEIFEIEDKDLDAFEDALAKRIAWSDAVELVQEALEDWVEAQYDLAGLCDEEDAEAIKRLTSETMKAWARILQG
jgi:hypothetical protein